MTTNLGRRLPVLLAVMLTMTIGVEFKASASTSFQSATDITLRTGGASRFYKLPTD